MDKWDGMDGSMRGLEQLVKVTYRLEMKEMGWIIR